MKCRPLRRRYVTFRCSADASDKAILDSINSSISPGITPKVGYRDGPFVVIRVDNRSLEAARLRGGIQFSINSSSSQLNSVSTSGTVRGAKEKIKKLQAKLRVGDEEAVPVIQKSKDVDKKTD
jgi:hypothetical protein